MAKGAGTNRDGRTTKPDKKILREMIEKKAYEIYEKGGGKHGKDLDGCFESGKIIGGERKDS